eukprot:s1596_g10.t1
MRVQEVAGEHELLVEPFDLSDNDEENPHQQVVPSSIGAFPWRLAAIMVVGVLGTCLALTDRDMAQGRPGDFQNNIMAASFSPSVKKALLDWKLKKAVAKAKVEKEIWCWKHRIYGVDCHGTATHTTTTSTATTTSRTVTTTLGYCQSGEILFSFPSRGTRVVGCIRGLSCDLAGQIASSVEVFEAPEDDQLGEFVPANRGNTWTTGPGCTVPSCDFRSLYAAGANGASLQMWKYTNGLECAGIGNTNGILTQCRLLPETLIDFLYIP